MTQSIHHLVSTPSLPPGSRVLGIDPGLDTTGYGIMALAAGGLRTVEAGVIRTTPDESLGSRIEQIYDGITEVLEAYEPCVVAVEQLHSNYKHPQTAILMGHARGVICLAASRRGIPIASYRPTQVKRILTGSGKATKEQIQRAVQGELGLKEIPKPPDVADALALGLCHVYVTRSGHSK